VRGTFHLARAYLAIALRERITLFWFLVFPLFLLALLAAIFGNVGQTTSLTFDIAVVNLDQGRAGRGDFGTLVAGTFRELGQPGASGKEPLFKLHEPGSGDVDAASYLASEIEALKVGKRDAVVEIPAGFSDALLAAAQGSTGGEGAEAPARVIVHTSGGRTSSGMALDIIEEVLAGVDKQILTQLGLFDATRGVLVGRQEVGSEDRTLGYVDFLIPGVVIMGFFVAGLFSVPGTILFGRESRVLRAYWVTPLDVPRFLAGFSLGHLGLCALQFACVWLLGRFAFGAHVNLFQPLPMLYLVLSMVTFLALGFLVAALARTANAGMAIANIVNMPMMFLGGLFYPTGSMPPALRVIMMANPVAYLADGLRASVGVSPALFPLAASVGVPCAWIVGCAIVAWFRLQWDVGR
jgi:ABC-2 type transport system permease protein